MIKMIFVDKIINIKLLEIRRSIFIIKLLDNNTNNNTKSKYKVSVLKVC